MTTAIDMDTMIHTLHTARLGRLFQPGLPTAQIGIIPPPNSTGGIVHGMTRPRSTGRTGESIPPGRTVRAGMTKQGRTDRTGHGMNKPRSTDRTDRTGMWGSTEKADGNSEAYHPGLNAPNANKEQSVALNETSNTHNGPAA